MFWPERFLSACLIVISVSGSRVTNYLLSSLSPQMTPNPQETLNFVSFEIKQKHCDMLLPCFSCKNVKNVFSNISLEFRVSFGNMSKRERKH